MIFQIAVTIGKITKYAEYDSDFHSGQTFLQEVEIITNRKDIFFFKPATSQPLAPERLHSMIEKAASTSLGEVFQGYFIEEKEGGQILHLGVGQNKKLEKTVKSSGRCSGKNKLPNLVNQMVPRVCDDQFARRTQLPIGSFITPEKSKFLMSPQQRYYDRVKELIETSVEEGKQKNNETLSKYFHQANKKLKFGVWGEGPTKKFAKSYEKWLQSEECQEFLVGDRKVGDQYEDDDDEDQDNEVNDENINQQQYDNISQEIGNENNMQLQNNNNINANEVNNRVGNQIYTQTRSIALQNNNSNIHLQNTLDRNYELSTLQNLVSSTNSRPQIQLANVLDKNNKLINSKRKQRNNNR